MRASILIAAHDEGESLSKTIRSCVEGALGLDHEIVVADDGSTDGSVEAAQQGFPQIRVLRHEKRLGVSPTKHLAASHARGDVLVFLDGHSNPEPGAIERLVENVELLEGQAVVTPKIPALCPKSWRNEATQVGHGYRMGLEKFDDGWLPLARMKAVRHSGRQFYESPAMIGCALAVSRELYDELHGFDPHMFSWGVENLDFSLKCWLLGHSILHDPEAAIGHRFQRTFDNFEVPIERLTVNQLRMARKNFTQGVWGDWLIRAQRRSPRELPDHPEGFWAYVWELFLEHEASAESERAYIHARRTRDEFWYAERFGLNWPKLVPGPKPSALDFLGLEQPLVEASPSPPPCMCKIQWDDGTPITDTNRVVLPGHNINLRIFCKDNPEITDTKWDLPGKVFKEYETSPAKGVLTPLTEAALEGTTVNFYWADVGTDRKVTVSFKADGVTCSAEATFDVRDPPVEFPFEDGVYFDPPPIGKPIVDERPPGSISLDNATPTEPDGIVFKAKVHVPGAFYFADGHWYFGQLVNTVAIRKTASTQKCKKYSTGAKFFSDEEWPYTQGAVPPTVPFPTGDTVCTVADNPETDFADSDQIKFAAYFRMYIMFQPAPDPPGAGPSMYVPLRRCSWFCEWCAEKGNAGWSIINHKEGSRKWDVERTHPEWTKNVTSLRFAPSTCPGPCSTP